MRFQFLKEHQKEYNIQKACKILRISRSGFYDYLKRRKSNRAIENEALTEMMEDIFHEHQGRYGARRIQKVLEQQNVHVNPKRVSLGRMFPSNGLIEGRQDKGIADSGIIAQPVTFREKMSMNTSRYSQPRFVGM